MKTSTNFWPLGITLAFVVFAAGMGAFVAIAVSHRDHLVSENYYEQEIKYQGQMESAARAEKTGATITYDSAKNQVVIALPAAQVNQHFSGTLQLYRPSKADLDQEFTLAPNADGAQTLDVSKLTAGLWEVRAHWSAAGQDYFLDQKIKI